MSATVSSETLAPEFDRNRRWRFDWVLPALLQPRQTFPRIAQASFPLWLTPIVILLASSLARIYVSGNIKAAAAATGQITLPPGFEYYTPEQQAQFQQALTATNSPTFQYVLPGVLAILGVFAAWLVVGWVLHLVLTMLGGRGSSLQALNIVAWASLPFALRDVVRTVAMNNSQQLLTYPGLSGFAAQDGSNLAFYLVALLALVDIYLVAHIFMIGLGMRESENLPALKTWSGVVLTVVGLLLLRALPALIAAQFNDLTVIRPFLY